MSKTKHFWELKFLPGLILFMACQYEDDGRQESPFIGLSGFVGKHLKSDHIGMCLCVVVLVGILCRLLICYFQVAFWVVVACTCVPLFIKWHIFLIILFIQRTAAVEAVKRPAIVICG